MPADSQSAPLAPSFSQTRWGPGADLPSSADSPAAAPSAPVRSVLFVCTGNICRSPYAQLLLAARAPELSVASRGTFSLVGHPMDEGMAARLAARGVDASSFRSAQLDAASLRADLILVMSENHRRFIRDEFPQALARTGLFGHIGSLRGLDAQSVRDWARTRQRGDGSVADPYGRGDAAADRAAEHLDALMDRLLALRSAEDAR